MIRLARIKFFFNNEVLKNIFKGSEELYFLEGYKS